MRVRAKVSLLMVRRVEPVEEGTEFELTPGPELDGLLARGAVEEVVAPAEAPAVPETPMAPESTPAPEVPEAPAEAPAKKKKGGP